MSTYDKHWIAKIEPSRKPKLNFEEQIAYLRDVKGVKFELITEEKAVEFLKNNTYLFKIKAYGKNFPKHTDGKYQNLDFAHLIELSTLDMYLREHIIKMTLNIEHYLKVQILRDAAENEAVDGYEIVKEFIKMKPTLIDTLSEKSENSYCKDLIGKRNGNYSLWDIVEILSFGDFIALYEFYYAKYKCSSKCMINNLKPVQWLRNAAAHNNCIINNLSSNNQTVTQNRCISLYIIKNCPSIKPKTREKKLKVKPVHDFIVTLYVFNMVVTSEKVKYHTMKDLKKFFDDRMKKNSTYFKNNPILLTNYEFAKIIVDHFYGLCNNM